LLKQACVLIIVFEQVTQKLPYDVLAVGVGARNNTFGIPGVTENCFFLKELPDAREIRRTILKNVEAASFPSIPVPERRRLLSFVIIGGGPTGVEFAAELHDLVVEDLLKMYPQLFPDVSITVVEGNKILGAFDQSLRYACCTI
jgi:NADH:ubiquinone reductase (non-electrogenic)